MILNAPKTIITQQEKSITITTLTVTRIIDLPLEKKVKAYVLEFTEPITLWSANAYDLIGQWTDTDVNNRLDELYN